MATAAREANRNRNRNQPPYEALGAGGKFRKTPFRRTSQTTPYDRPTPNRGGWFTKLVDPAQKLITYGAHRLFSSVFQKRLAPPPPPSSSTEVNHEGRIMDRDEVAMEPSGVQRGADEHTSGPTTGDGFSLLEQIFEQKSFTRPEIDRLKELLHSRTVDTPSENIEKRSEVIPSTAVVSHGREEEFAKTPMQSTPVVSTTVLDEDVASPVELAKAYMGSRPSKISPLMLGLRSQPAYESTHISSSVAFPSQSPLMSVVPRVSSNGAAAENGYATPRSRGRSAIHSMARTPYSRVQTRSTMKGFGSTVDSYCAPSSSSRSIWEQGQTSGSKQGALKRRFSVLDNDIGSIGPIRRIRPKPNLLSSRGLSSPISTEAYQNPSSSTNRPLVSGETKHTLVKALSENGDNAVPRTSFSNVPSQSSKAASKIFEHLDKEEYSEQIRLMDIDPMDIDPPASSSSSGSWSWSWKPGNIELNIPISRRPPLGFGIHFPESSGIPPFPGKLVNGMTRKIADRDDFDRINRAYGDYSDREFTYADFVGTQLLLDNWCLRGKDLSKVSVEEFSQHFDSHDEHMRKFQQVTKREKEATDYWRRHGEPRNCNVCLKSAYHLDRGCPYLTLIEQPWNAAVGEGYTIFCYCCQKPKSKLRHLDGTWSGYATLIVKGSKTEKFMNRNRPGRDIRNQIIGHLRLQYESSYTEATVLQDIPASIRSKISQDLYFSYIVNIPLFKGCSTEFINQIVIKLHEEFFLPGEVIMEPGNVVDQVYFVCHGVLFDELHSGRRTGCIKEEVGLGEDGTEETVSLLEPNSSFGEVSILCNIPQPYRVRVCELCRLLRLDKQSFTSILDIYFYDGRKILNNLLEGKGRSILNTFCEQNGKNSVIKIDHNLF